MESASTFASFQRRAPAAVCSVGAKCGTDAADLVCGDRYAGARPAQHDTVFGRARSNALAGRPADLRPRLRVSLDRAERYELVPHVRVMHRVRHR